MRGRLVSHHSDDGASQAPTTRTPGRRDSSARFATRRSVTCERCAGQSAPESVSSATVRTPLVAALAAAAPPPSCSERRSSMFRVTNAALGAGNGMAVASTTAPARHAGTPDANPAISYNAVMWTCGRLRFLRFLLRSRHPHFHLTRSATSSVVIRMNGVPIGCALGHSVCTLSCAQCAADSTRWCITYFRVRSVCVSSLIIAP